MHAHHVQRQQDGGEQQAEQQATGDRQGPPAQVSHVRSLRPIGTNGCEADRLRAGRRYRRVQMLRNTYETEPGDTGAAERSGAGCTVRQAVRPRWA
ncbi:hypothetical protein JCM9534A_26690 [Catenuloplanes indicus JCM 9534]